MPDPLLLAAILLSVLYGLVFYQLMQWWQHRPPPGWPSPLCNPVKAKRPPPLPGLINKPHCEACAEEAAHDTPARPTPPPMLHSQQGRPCRLDTSGHYCPNRHCRYSGWLDRGNLRANGHPSGRRWRQLYCVACEHFFLETHGTLFYGKSHSPETILHAIAALAEGLGIRATGRVFGVEANTILSWLAEAADHAETVSCCLLHDLEVEQVQLDELFALIGEHRAGQIDEQDIVKRLARRPRWVWAAIDPVSKLWIHVAIGDRCLAMAQQLVHHVVRRLAPDCQPLFLSDSLRDYATALLTHFGHWVQHPRRQPQGPPPKPRWCALSQLRYAQVIKKCRRRRWVKLIQRVVFGSRDEIDRVLARHGWQINTAFIERLNLTLRQHIAAIGRRVITLAKSDVGLHRQLHLFQAYYNVCREYASLRSAWTPDSNRPTPRGRTITPAMAAGLTDHAWSLRELLLFRVPLWQHPALE